MHNDDDLFAAVGAMIVGFIVLVIFTGVICYGLGKTNGYKRGYNDGSDMTIEYLQNDAVQWSVGEYYIDHNNEKAFRWVSPYTE